MASSALQPRLAMALSRPLLGGSAPMVVGLESRRWIHLRAAQRARPTRTGGLGTRTTAPGSAPSSLPSRRKIESSPAPTASPAHLVGPGTTLAFLPFLPSLTDLSSTLLSHPLTSPLTGLPSYGLTIVLLTLLVRAGTTLPATIWARRRAIRFREEVKPRMRGANERLAVEVMKECRKAGVGYEGYKNELRKRLTEYQAILVKQYRCHPLPTLALPPLIHLPIFLTLSLTIRQAVTTPLPSASASPPSELVDSAATSLPLDAPSALVPFATESFAWLTNLVEPDPTLALPFVIGLMAYGNIEMMQAFRASQDAALPVNEESGPGAALSSSTAAAAPPAPARPTKSKARNLPPPVVRRTAQIVQSEDAAGNMTPAERAKRAALKEQGSMRNRVVSNVLRLVAVASVGIAAQAPAAVALYWATSTTFTLVQNAVLDWLEKRKKLAA